MTATLHPRPTLKAVTWFGLVLAIFGTPLLLWAWPRTVGPIRATTPYLVREAAIFGMLGLLGLLVRWREGAPWRSVGLHLDHPLRSLRDGILWTFLIYAVMVPCVGVAHLMNWKLGLQTAPAYTPPVWAMAVTVLRAGVTEEAFYRGYAIERLQAFVGGPWAAAVLTSIPFALFHYAQGPAGMLIAGSASLVLSATYIRRRDLLANMIAHFTVDLLPNVVLPLFGLA